MCYDRYHIIHITEKATLTEASPHERFLAIGSHCFLEGAEYESIEAA